MPDPRNTSLHQTQGPESSLNDQSTIMVLAFFSFKLCPISVFKVSDGVGEACTSQVEGMHAYVRYVVPAAFLST